jgi:hypothetical protein
VKSSDLAKPQRSPALPHAYLTSLAVTASLIAAVVNRALLIFLDSRTPHSVLLELNRWGQFATTLAVIASLLAFLNATLGLANRSIPVPFLFRITAGALAVVLILIIGRAALLPGERTSGFLFWMATGAAHALGALIALEAARWARGFSLRATVLAAAGMAILALFALIVDYSRFFLLWRWQAVAIDQLRHAGEAGYLVTLVGGTVFVFGAIRSWRETVSLLVAALIFAVTSAIGLWALDHARGDFILAVHYWFRLTWLLDRHPAVYVAIICAAGSATVFAFAVRDEAKKAIAMAILLLICSGYSPSSADRLIIYVLAALQLAYGALMRIENMRKEAVVADRN